MWNRFGDSAIKLITSVNYQIHYWFIINLFFLIPDEGMVSPNDGRTGPNEKGAKMQTSLAAAPRVRTTEEHSKLKLPFPPTNNGLMMEVVSLLGLRWKTNFSNGN